MSETGQSDLRAEFVERYRIIGEDAMMRVERVVYGTDYGVSSYTTKEQADGLAEALDLGPGVTLLDVGGGAGWPAIYLADTTGCQLILSDFQPEALTTAASRAVRDQVDAVVIAASGDSLPLKDESVGAVMSSDVFC
jgi:ubiquinone/menaquinone biosynthesis C-methylase UbiE